MLFDTHAHMDSRSFDCDREALLADLPNRGIRYLMNPGCSLASSHAAVELANKYDYIYAAVGSHPDAADEVNDAVIAEYRKLCKLNPKIKAIGEIGLDYHYEDIPRQLQKKAFIAQLELAKELDLPVIVHDREAHGDSLAVVLDYPALRGVFHCFSGSPEMAQELLKRGWYLGFDGPITYKNAKRAPEVAAVTPLDRIVVETDAPYLTPVPYRGKRNDSRYLPYVIEKLAEWKGVSPEEMTDITLKNGKRLFGLE